MFRPAAKFRPLVGAGVLRWVGDTVDGKEQVPESLGTFDPPSVWMMQFKGGAEAEMSRLIDLFVHVPVTVNLGGSGSDTYNKGEALSPETGQPYIDTGSDKAPAPPAVGVRLIVGMQLKFLLAEVQAATSNEPLGVDLRARLCDSPKTQWTRSLAGGTSSKSALSRLSLIMSAVTVVTRRPAS